MVNKALKATAYWQIKKEAGTRFELADIPFAEDSLEPLGQPAFCGNKRI